MAVMTKAALYARINSMRAKYHIEGTFDPWDFAAKHGYAVVYHCFDDHNIKGFLVRVPGAEHEGIVLNSELTKEEQRCILTHELVHSELHGAFSRVYEVDDNSSSYTEYQADEGAAELLIPYREFIPRFCKVRRMMNSRPTLILRQLAKEYGVDSEYMRRRIKSLEFETQQYLNGVPLDKIELKSKAELEKRGISADKSIKRNHTPTAFNTDIYTDEDTMEVNIKACAKVNLTLDVLGKMPNGYHELCMIMQSIDLHDNITLSRSKDGIRLFCSDDSLPNNSDNLCVKAAEKFFEYAKITPSVDIVLEKHIPVAAGLAGGSADAAAVLKGLNILYGTGYDDKVLCDIGVKCGADVPFCIVGGTKLCEGIGDMITPLPPMPQCFIVLVKPDFPVSTPQVYKAIDAVSYSHPDNKGAVMALEQGNLCALCGKMANVLELVTGGEHPEIAEIEAELDSFGAIKSMMSGSGPTVFGIFDDEAKAVFAARQLKRPDRRVILTKPVEKSEPYCKSL